MLKLKRVFLLFCMLLPLFSLSVSAENASKYAEYNSVSEQYNEYYREQMDASGANQLMSALDDQTTELLGQLGVDEVDLEHLLNISPQSLLELFLKIITGKMNNPLKIFASVLSIIVLCAMMECFKVSFGEKSLEGLFSLVSAVLIGLIIVVPMMECISHVCSAITLSSDFMLVFVPVVTILLAASGKPLTASGLNLVIFTAAELISRFSSSLLVPLLCIYLAFSIVGVLSPDINLSGLSEILKKSVNFILGLFSTIFVSLLSLQGVLGQSADTVATRTTKFLVGSFVPVVGGAIGDTITTVQGCVALTKNTVGAFGLIAALLIYIPIAAELIIWVLCIQSCSAAAALFGLKTAGELLKAIGYTLSLLLSILLFCAVLLIISTGIMVVIGGGGA